MIRRRSKATAGAILGTALLVLGSRHGAILFAGLTGGRSGPARQQRCAVVADAAPEVEEQTAAEITAPVDLRSSPWEAVLPPYQREAKRCWGAGADGKVPGYVAELYRRGSPLEQAPPPLRRRWLNRKRVAEDLQNPYTVLGIEKGAPFESVRKAYLQKAREEHPDIGGDADDFAEILLAYRILKNEDRREHFDETGQDLGEPQDEEVRWAMIPQFEVLKKAVMNHRGFKAQPELYRLCGLKGSVIFDDFERGLTQLEVNGTFEDANRLNGVDPSEQTTVAAWIPTHVLMFLSEEYGEQIEFDAEQQKAIVLLKGGALTKPNFEMLARLESQTYALGWRAHEDDTGVASPMRDQAFAQSFFKEGRENEESGVVLDLGCGDGEASRQFASSEKFSVIFGLDKNSTSLMQARKNCEELKLGPEQGVFLLRSDAEDLPFLEQQIDYVWWGFGLEEVDHPEKVLRDLYRMMKIGGRLALSTRNGVKTAKTVQRMLQEIGFKDTKVYPPRAGIFLNYAYKLDAE